MKQPRSMVSLVVFLWFYLFATAVAPAVLTSGCASLLQGVPVVAGVVTDALSALEVIDAAANEFFRSREVPAEVRTAYLNAYTRAVVALNAANHALRGMKNVDQQAFDQAFAEFRLAFGELRQLLEAKGLMTAGRLTVGGQTVVIPEPEALTFRVDR